MSRTQTKNGQPAVYNVTPITLSDGDAGALQVDANGYLITSAGGAVSSDKAEDSASVSGDTGVFVLGVRNDAGVVLTNADGDYTAMAVDSLGNSKVNLATSIAGEDIPNDILKTETRSFPLNITTNGTTVVKSGVGVFYGFTVNNNGFTTAGTITVYDNTAASGTKIGTWTVPLQPPGTVLLATTFFPPQLGLNASFSVGLTFVTANTAPAADITVLYR